MHGVSITACWMAAVRARETDRSDRLFEDPLAGVLAGSEGFDLMERMDLDLGENPTLAIRTRFFDDVLMSVLHDRAIGQVVLLAAGMDARAYRLDLPKVFELDHAELLQLKDARLAGVSAKPRCQRVTVGADLAAQWLDDLTRAGFDARQPAAFVAEGLLGYLEERDVHRFLDTLDRAAAPGSALLADVSGRSALDAPYLAFWYRRLADNGIAGARFGTDDPEGLLGAHGWQPDIYEYGDEQANFGRWPYPRFPRDDLSVPHNYLIVAER